jgi:outer membrane protein OmpA-like peptidoglycan-associated protein
MRARGWTLTLVLAASLSAHAAWAKDQTENRFSITPFGGWTIFDRELQFASGQRLKDAAYLGGRVGVRLFPGTWIEAAGGYTSTKPDAGSDDVKWTHYSGNLLVGLPTTHAFAPFISAGFGRVMEKHDVLGDTSSNALEGAVGANLRLGSHLGLRLEARDVLRVPRHIESAHIADIVVGAGLTFAFGGGRVPDSDGDGVPDKSDKCPNTPHGCNVDAEGCPIDGDKDGVCDGLDKCPNTPLGAKVDANGCPIDSDGDGVFDGLDQCPNTPTGCTVDAKGCPTDSDGDGVCDGLDQCPNTPLGCKVDAKGCPIDSDGDGVCDGMDKCPNTPVGAKVDKDGCPIEVMERETELLDTGMIRIQDINFETAKWDLPTDAGATLDPVGQVLSKWPELQIEIGGHTDSRGSAAYNQKLSEQRANSVRQYMLDHFPNLKPDQYLVKGYGESKPIAPNTSALNMAKNRRVEFKVLNKETLKRESERRRLLKQGEGAPSDTTRR